MTFLHLVSSVLLCDEVKYQPGSHSNTATLDANDGDGPEQTRTQTGGRWEPERARDVSLEYCGIVVLCACWCLQISHWGAYANSEAIPQNCDVI